MLADDTRWYLLCRRSPVPEEVTGAELICFHLILPDSGKMRLRFCVCVCACLCVRSRSNSGSWEALRWREASQVRPLDCGRGWLELLCWKGVISILVKWSATPLLTSLAPTPCMHTQMNRNTHPAFAFLLPPFLLMKCPCSHYLKKKEKKKAAYTYQLHRSGGGEREKREALEEKRGGTITITVEVEILLDRT